MTQLSLFETSTQISLSDTVVAVNFRGRWEIYSTEDYAEQTKNPYPRSGSPLVGFLEKFSHYATPAESTFCYFGRSL